MSFVRPLAGKIRSLTKMQWAAVTVFVLAAAIALRGAAVEVWSMVVLGLLLGVGVLLAVEIFGFRQLTRRINQRLDRVVPRRIGRQPMVEDKNQALVADEVLHQWAAELRSWPGRLNWFIKLARETRSRGSREVLALCATQGAYGYRTLMKLAEQALLHPENLEEQAQLRRALWRPGLFGLARVLYSQRLSEWDLRNCLTLYELAARIYNIDRHFDGVDRSLYSDLLTWNAQFAKADEVLDYPEPVEWRAFSQRFLQLNAVNPNITGLPHKRGEWLARLNERFTESGLAPLDFPEGESPSFSNIRVQAPPLRETNLPLVSIIMPIYEPDASTDVAIQSLLNQTWTNIEVLIIDDASPAYLEDGTPTTYRQQLEAWAVTDPRIRLTFCEQNRGAYAVRNEAFASARGEFVTVADKDDWHHPQKIERQARDLLTHRTKNANIVNWVRVDESLKFLVRWGPDRVVHPSFASIMYRRAEVLEKLGFWDAVRKSADGEYRTRFEIAFGEKLVTRDHVPMAFSLLGDGNLTSNDFGLGYRHPDREIYQDAYGDWHKRIRSGASPFMPEDPRARKFVGPTSFLPERDKSHVPHYDVIYLSEFGLQGGNALTLEREIRSSLDSGLKVGIVALQNGLIPSASKRRIVPVLERLFLEGSVDRLTLDRVATADLMLIHWPTVMQLLPAAESGIKADRIMVVANQLPGLMSQSRQSYDAADVSLNCGEIFGQHPVWAAQSSSIYEALRAMLPSTQLSRELWHGIAPQDGPTRVPNFEGRPILGRPMDEEERNWPKTRWVRECLLPTDGSAEVLLEGRPKLMVRERILEEPTAPIGWTIEYPSPDGPSAYLGRIDFYLGHTRDVGDESTEPYIVEALRKGVVCILPPELRDQFGDAALYADHREVSAVIANTWNPQEYLAQQKRGLAFVQSNRSAEDYLDRIR